MNTRAWRKIRRVPTEPSAGVTWGRAEERDVGKRRKEGSPIKGKRILKKIKKGYDGTVTCMHLCEMIYMHMYV